MNTLVDDIPWEFCNYRVMIGFDGTLSIRKVFYSEAGYIMHWNMAAVDLYESDVNSLYNMYKDIDEAFDKPILMERDLENQFLEEDAPGLPQESNDEDE